MQHTAIIYPNCLEEKYIIIARRTHNLWNIQGRICRFKREGKDLS